MLGFCGAYPLELSLTPQDSVLPRHCCVRRVVRVQSSDLEGISEFSINQVAAIDNVTGIMTNKMAAWQPTRPTLQPCHLISSGGCAAM